ncbi:MAG: hypothetical protein HYV68_01660, partial [Candidatus Taylorbacteria bacterium]|nr:hypothetical protein [Candidatus Taylorbacteria bacterium]
LAQIGAFNIHPSLLPKYRGPSPLQSQILADEKERGVSVIKMDERVDHGPILASSSFDDTDRSFIELGIELFKAGTKLLINELPRLMNGEAKLRIQNDTHATFTKKFEKTDGALDPEGGREAWLKYLALSHSPGAYFTFREKSGGVRLKITAAKFEAGRFVPLRVIPEAKREMSYQDFLRGHK